MDLLASNSTFIQEMDQPHWNLHAFGIGFCCVTLISMCAIFGIFVIRYLSKEAYGVVITLFVGLGVGSLSGSSFYHLFPQGYPKLMEEVDDNGNRTYGYLFIAHFCLVGIYSFYFIDKFIKIFVERRKKTRRDRRTVVDEAKNYTLLAGQECNRPTSDDPEAANRNATAAIGDQAHGVCVHDHAVPFKAGESAIAAVAWMIIFGDGFHNFMDGISIGASFSESISSGVSVSLAVLCEEFPHELGDVAILIASGMSISQALFYNLLSAMTCYIGFFGGYFMGELSPDLSKFAFSIAGGMFLYISLVCMMPEMKKAMEDSLNVSFGKGIKVLALQTIGLLSGVTLMFLMARYSEMIF